MRHISLSVCFWPNLSLRDGQLRVGSGQSRQAAVDPKQTAIQSSVVSTGLIAGKPAPTEWTAPGNHQPSGMRCTCGSRACRRWAAKRPRLQMFRTMRADHLCVGGINRPTLQPGKSFTYLCFDHRFPSISNIDSSRSLVDIDRSVPPHFERWKHQEIRCSLFLVVHFPNILSPHFFRCGRLGCILVSAGRCCSAIGFDRQRRYYAYGLPSMAAVRAGTLACAGTCIVRRSVNPCTAATLLFDSG